MAIRVGELARRTGVGVSTLRAWERRFSFLEPERSPAGHRLYVEADVERVDTVLRLVAEGLTLAAAITRVANVGSGPEPAGEAEALLYRQILHAADQGIWVSRDGRTRYANRHMCQIMGYSLAELVAIPVLEFFKPEELPAIRERTALVREGRRLHFTAELRRADGSMFLAEVNTTPLVNQTGRYDGAVSLVSDITERDQLDRDRRERELQAETLALLGAQALGRRKDPRGPEPVVLTEVVEATRRLLQADNVALLELVGGELRLRAASPPALLGAVLKSGSRSFAGYTALARSVVVVDDADDDHRFDSDPTLPDCAGASAIGAPIFGPEGIRGVLTAMSRERSRFNHGQAHFIQGMANIIGTTLLD